MSNTLVDISGQRFGALTVIAKHDRHREHDRHTYWLCRCDCWKMIVCRGDNLKRGHTTQCDECAGTGMRSVE